jgi:glycosyltransferase involved in cell wall biosynthesis
VIVVVDGSTDETDAILAKYDDPRLIVHRTPNQGLPRALNTGFSLARGDYLSWTSDDNAYLPEAIAVLAARLDADPAAAMACTDCLIIDDRGRTTGYSDDTWACFLYRASAARAAGPYRPEFRLVEDVDFFLRLQHFGGPIVRIPHPHYRYRVHGQSLSAKQIAARQLASLKLHHDLITRGIENESLRGQFFDRLNRSAMFSDYAAMDEMVAFAREQHVPFADEFAARLLKTPAGWLVNRVRLAAVNRAASFRLRLAHLRRLAGLA